MIGFLRCTAYITANQAGIDDSIRFYEYYKKFCCEVKLMSFGCEGSSLTRRGIASTDKERRFRNDMVNYITLSCGHPPIFAHNSSVLLAIASAKNG